MRSFLGVPIFGNRGVFGNLYLAEKTDGETFTEEDEDIAILLAAKTAAAVENARHHEESARLPAEVQQLHRTRERFFAMVNHELRNALAAVYGWSEMLVRKKDPATRSSRGFRGARLGSTGDRSHQRSAGPESVGRGSSEAHHQGGRADFPRRSLHASGDSRGGAEARHASTCFRSQPSKLRRPTPAELSKFSSICSAMPSSMRRRESVVRVSITAGDRRIVYQSRG